MVEPRKYEYIEFADGVEGIQFASSLSKDRKKKRVFLGVEPRIIEEMLKTKILKKEELFNEDGVHDSEGNYLWLEIPTHKIRNSSHLSTNPRLWAICNFRGEDMSLLLESGQSEGSYIRSLEEENHRLNLHIFSLEKDLKEAESDIARHIRTHKERFKPMIEELKELRPAYIIPSTKTTKRRPV